MYKHLLSASTALLVAVATSFAAEPTPNDTPVILENDLLRVTISPIGGRATSVFDKLRQREEVKNLPYVGGLNEIRYGAVFNLDEGRDRFVLTPSRQADGTQTIEAVAKVLPSDAKPAAATVIKRYTLAPGSSRLDLSFEVRNEGTEELGLIPWLRNLLLRGSTEQPEEAHMTENGAYLSGRPYPSTRDKPVSRMDFHHFPASNWTSRVPLPIDEHANTMAIVTRPEDTFKLYNWHRGNEDFSTFEVIAQPFFAPPGRSFRWDYSMVWVPPVRNVVHASTSVVIGVTPHPTWLAPDTRQLELEFASPLELPASEVQAIILSADRPNELVHEYSFTLPPITPRGVARYPIAVGLRSGTYQLRMAFTKGHKPSPGEERPEFIIPLIVGTPEKVPAVFPRRTSAQGRLRQIEPKVRQAPLAFSCDAFDAYSYPSALRCFRQDTFQSTGQAPLKLSACAGEYESRQLILQPKTKAAATYAVAGAALTGPGGAQVECESINDFLYVPTKTPSSYNALFPVGEYPEALLPVRQTTVQPDGNHPLFITWKIPRDAKPGTYRGAITLTSGEGAGAVRHEIPVELNVWNIQLPLRGRWMEFASSLKGAGLAEARHADGKPYTAT